MITAIVGLFTYSIGWYMGYITGRLIEKQQLKVVRVKTEDLYPRKPL